jgi:ABC-type branched-subunit amino acid transport system ATPase component
VFTFNLLLILIGGVFIGGAGTLFGPVVGVAIFEGISLWIGPFSSYNDLFVGAGVIVVAIAFRGGVIPRLQTLGAFVTVRSGPLRDRTGLWHKPTEASEDIDIARSGGVDGMQLLEPIGAHDGLTASGISKDFQGVRALSDVDVQVCGGELLGLIGSNGSGKTTLLNIITGFVAADSGRVTVDGVDLSGRLPAYIARHGIGRTFQVPRLVDRLSVRRNIELGLIGRQRQMPVGSMLRLPRFRRLERERRDLITRTWNQIGLDTALLNQPVRTLSLGLKRIVEVARAAIAGPPVICLDEPAAGLDNDERDLLGNVLRAMVAQGRSVLLIEHNIRFVLDLCDSIVLLETGTIVGRGRPKDNEIDEALRDYINTYVVDVVQ